MDEPGEGQLRAPSIAAAANAGANAWAAATAPATAGFSAMAYWVMRTMVGGGGVVCQWFSGRLSSGSRNSVHAGLCFSFAGLTVMHVPATP